MLKTTAEHCFVVWTMHNDRFDYRALGSSRKLRGAAEHLIDGSEKRICRLSFKFRVRMLLKGAVNVIHLSIAWMYGTSNWNWPKIIFRKRTESGIMWSSNYFGGGISATSQSVSIVICSSRNSLQLKSVFRPKLGAEVIGRKNLCFFVELWRHFFIKHV